MQARGDADGDLARGWGGSAGGREPPRVIGVVREAGDVELLEARAPCRRAARRRSAACRLAFRQNTARRNASGGIAASPSEPLVLPIGAVSPSRIWSRRWPVARRPAIADARQRAVDDRGGRDQMRRACARTAASATAGWFGSFQIDQRVTRRVARRRPVSPRSCPNSAPPAPHERPVRLRVGLAGAHLAPAPRRPRRDRAVEGEQHLQPARLRAAHEVVDGSQADGGYAARILGRRSRSGASWRPATARSARPDHVARARRRRRAPRRRRAQRLDGRAELEHLVLVLDHRLLGGRGVARERRGSRTPAAATQSRPARRRLVSSSRAFQRRDRTRSCVRRPDASTRRGRVALGDLGPVDVFHHASR